MISCMCTPPPDTVTIKGLRAGVLINSGISNQCVISISSVHSVDAGEKKHCLTYNKLEASDVVKNGIIEGSFILLCDKNIDTIKAGNAINIKQPEISNGKAVDSKLLLDISKMSADSLYNFTLSCRTLDNETLKTVFSVQL